MTRRRFFPQHLSRGEKAQWLVIMACWPALWLLTKVAARRMLD